MPRSLHLLSQAHPLGIQVSVRIPALSELPMIKVVHPAYHAFPKGGHPSFWPSGNRRLSCVRVFATASTSVNDSVSGTRKTIDIHSAGYVIALGSYG